MSLCFQCQKEITSKSGIKFCSRSCAATYNNLKIGARHGQPIKIGICLNCNKEFKICKNATGKYCSCKCQQEHQWNYTKEQIIKENKILTTSHSRQARKFLKERDGILCQVCKKIEWENREIPLVLDHIDGNSENWFLNNLRLICCNCDAQTSTYKGKNFGNGRYYRRIRYQQGLSY